MTRRKEGRQYPVSRIILTSAAALVILFILVLSRIWIETRSASYIDRSVEENIHEVMRMAAAPFSDKLERTLEDLALIDGIISKSGLDRSARYKDIEPFIDIFVQSEHPVDIAFLDKKCRIRTADGEYGHFDTTFDIVSLFGDKKPILRTLEWLQGRNCFIVAIPVEDFSMDGEVFSSILAAYDIRTIEDILNVGSYSNEAAIHIVDNNCATLFSNVPSEEYSDNRLANYKVRGIIDEARMAAVQKDLAVGSSGGLVIEKDGKEMFMCYSSISPDRNILMEVPASSARSVLSKYKRMIVHTVSTLAVLMLLLIFVLGVVAIINSRNRAVAREEAKLREQTEKHNLELNAARLAADEANMAKSRFLSNMSHDIRTPMNAITGFLRLAMANMDDKERLGDYLNKVNDSSKHLLSLINDVLDMSRIESGKTNIEMAPENLREVLSTTTSVFEADLARKDLGFSLDTDGIVDEHVICDKLHLNQVFLNILSNAVKYTPAEGKINMSVTQEDAGREGYAKYVFKVRDNGIGMDEEFRKTIFNPFSRERNSTVSGIQGTGLGMAITNNLVKMMGGSIDVWSEKGKGTEITVSMDLAIDRNYKEESVDADIEYSFEGKKILLVDDNELNREIATMILETEGFILDTAEDGTVAVDKIAKAQPGDYDIVLMDIQMPVMNGYDATRNIRKLDAPLAGIPIIAMTANAFDEDRKAAMDAGMNEHVAKPIDVDILKKTLAKFL